VRLSRYRRRIEALVPISVTVHDMLQAANVIYEAQGKRELNIRVHMKIRAVSSSGRSVLACTNTHCHNTEYLNPNICSCETSNIIVVLSVYLDNMSPYNYKLSRRKTRSVKHEQWNIYRRMETHPISETCFV
jgi:hypothetical protein